LTIGSSLEQAAKPMASAAATVSETNFFSVISFLLGFMNFVVCIDVIIVVFDTDGVVRQCRPV
jgi:hypothetical protein